MEFSKVSPLFAAAIVLLLCCDEGDDLPRPNPGRDAGTEVVRPGLGDDPGTPSGTPFALPAGITIPEPIVGADDLTSDCGDGKPGYGSGVYVQVCVPIRNTTGAPVEVVFPPGLVITSAAELFQNGLLVERVVITVPPTPPPPGGMPDGGVAAGAYVVPLFTYCLNESRNPNEKGTPYVLGPISDDAAIADLIERIGGATIDRDEEVAIVQSAIYAITESRGLTDEDRAALAALE